MQVLFHILAYEFRVVGFFDGWHGKKLCEKKTKRPRQGHGIGIAKIMADVIELKKEKKFTLHEAKNLLPIVKRITQEAIVQTEELRTEEERSKIIERWAIKIAKLGCQPKGLWLVDFDNGSGYYCWHYPEDDVEFFHNYEGGFKGRTPIL